MLLRASALSEEMGTMGTAVLGGLSELIHVERLEQGQAHRWGDTSLGHVCDVDLQPASVHRHLATPSSGHAAAVGTSNPLLVVELGHVEAQRGCPGPSVSLLVSPWWRPLAS